jgi:hypothetical protein
MGRGIVPELPGRSSQRASPRGSPPPPCSIPAGHRVHPTDARRIRSPFPFGLAAVRRGLARGPPRRSPLRRRGPHAMSRSPLPIPSPGVCKKPRVEPARRVILLKGAPALSRKQAEEKTLPFHVQYSGDPACTGTGCEGGRGFLERTSAGGLRHSEGLRLGETAAIPRLISTLRG